MYIYIYTPGGPVDGDAADQDALDVLRLYVYIYIYIYMYI